MEKSRGKDDMSDSKPLLAHLSRRITYMPFNIQKIPPCVIMGKMMSTVFFGCLLENYLKYFDDLLALM